MMIRNDIADPWQAFCAHHPVHATPWTYPLHDIYYAKEYINIYVLDSGSDCFIEKWGQGIRKILSKEPVVTFKEVGRQFITVFRRKGETVEKTVEKTTQKILEAIENSPQISRKELAIMTNITEDGVKYHLNRLKKTGRIKRVGPDKGGHWEVL